MKRFDQSGFTLIELVLVIVIVGLLASIAMNSGRQFYDTARVEEARQELDALAYAVGGNPALESNGFRSDFGYVGDVGALPPDLDALVTNPGGYATWRGPYVHSSFTQFADDFKTDPWGSAYVYAGVTITSNGSGGNIVRRLAAGSGELLANRVSGVIRDRDGTPPGPIYADSLTAVLAVPDGAGSMVIRNAAPDAGGYFVFDSVPIGTHDLSVAYGPTGETVTRIVSVVPGTAVYTELSLPTNVWAINTATPEPVGQYTADSQAANVTGD